MMGTGKIPIIKERSLNPEYDPRVTVMKITSTNITLNALIIGALFTAIELFTPPTRKTSGPEMQHTMAREINSSKILDNTISIRRAKTTAAII